MSNSLVLSNKNIKINSHLFNLAAIICIYLLPAFSHLLSFPLYMVDPMRVIILLSVIHTSNRNSYLIAFTLPLFSFLIASHPVAAKSLLIGTELILNIWLFYQIYNKLTNKFFVMFVSILISKIYYYLAKSILISAGLLQVELISTPVYLQLAVAMLISGYLLFITRLKSDWIIEQLFF